MATKLDSFANEYIPVDNEFIETTVEFTRNFVARETYIANNREFTRSFNYAAQLVAMKLIHMIWENNGSRLYLDDIRDFVATQFAAE